MLRMADRVAHFSTTIFSEMTSLANQHQAINLGQGFPDFAAPDFLKEAARAAIAADVNQYAPPWGRPRLRRAIAGKMARHYALSLDPDREVQVTHGATEAIFAGILGLINPGDEVILFEPTYDSYVPAVQLAGGVPRYYTLRPPAWTIEPETLAALFSPHTRLLVLNTPHNPTGKVFTLAELEMIARLCQEYNVLVLADEVYEYILFDGLAHTPVATLPGMFDRTVTVSSLGKTFSVTGWKVGWAVGPADLLQAMFRMRQFMTFCGAAPLQEAAAVALEMADGMGYYTELARQYQQKRDFLRAALAEVGLRPITPQGTYFVMARIDGLGFGDDVGFCRHLTTQTGVAAIPPSAFYHRPGDGAHLARFAFCKADETLRQAAARLRHFAPDGKVTSSILHGE